MTITQFKESLIGMSHSGTLNKVRNFEALLERACNVLLVKLDPVETIRKVPLSQIVYDDLQQYSLPSDYKKPIDIAPEDNRQVSDGAQRVTTQPFNFQLGIRNKQIVITGSEGAKIILINWKSQGSKVLNTMDSLTSNGTWSVVGTASGLAVDNLIFKSGSGSLKFNLAVSGDGIKNTTMTAVDLSAEENLGASIWPMYLEDYTKITSVTPVWGENLTTKYWTGVAQTAQADGTAFKNGWNYIRVSWSTAVKTGSPSSSSTKAFQMTFVISGAASNVRVDNILFGLGRAFGLTYYSKYLIKNSAGVLQSRTSSDDDTVILDSDAINILLFETLKMIAQQTESEDSAFDMQYANRELFGDPTALDPRQRAGLYSVYRGEYPSESVKAMQRWSSGPRFKS